MKKDSRGELIRQILRIVDNYPFPNDPYNIHKDALFFKIAGLL